MSRSKTFCDEIKTERMWKKVENIDTRDKKVQHIKVEHLKLHLKKIL